MDEYLEQIVAPHQHVLRIYTKIDKLNQKELSALMRRDPGAMMVSNTKKRGIEKLVAKIHSLLQEA